MANISVLFSIYLTIEVLIEASVRFILTILGWLFLSGCSRVEIVQIVAEVEVEVDSVLIVATTGCSPPSLSVSDHAQHREAK